MAQLEPQVTGPNAPPAESADDELIAGKFKSVEDLVKSYKELESRFGSSKSGDDNKSAEAEGGEQDTSGDNKEETEQKQDDQTSADEDPYGPVISNALQVAGLDANDVTKHFTEHGEISDEHYAALEKVGFNRSVVDTYLAGVRAASTQAEDNARSLVTQALDITGGQDEYNRMINWANQNLTDDEKRSYISVIEGQDENAVRFAVQAMYGRFVRDAGGQAKRVTGKSMGSQQTGGFTSQEEMVAAMRDPRYFKPHTPEGRAYIEEVQKKIAASRGIFRRRS